MSLYQIMFSLDSRAPLHCKNIGIICNNLQIIAKCFHGVVDRTKKDQVCLPYYACDLAFVGRFAMFFTVTTRQLTQDPTGPLSTTISRQAIVETNKTGARGGEHESVKEEGLHSPLLRTANVSPRPSSIGAVAVHNTSYTVYCVVILLKKLL